MMNRNSKILANIFIVIIFVGCGNKQENPTPEQTVVAEDHSHQMADSFAGMKLNEDQKWMMDEHTRSSFKKMVASFKASDHSTVAGLQNIGGELRGQVNELLKGCTMDGAAHNQLHIFMTGYIPAVDSLSSSVELETGKRQAMKIKEYLEVYDTYFE